MTNLYVRIALVIVMVSASSLRVASAQTAEDPAKIEVDLRDATRYVFHARLSLPVKPGPMTLVYPKWIPGGADLRSDGAKNQRGGEGSCLEARRRGHVRVSHRSSQRGEPIGNQAGLFVT